MRRDVVWVVEDDRALRDLLGEVLGEDGYRVLEAPDGQAAVDFIDRYPRPPERLRLVLLDMMLPRVDGMFVLRRLHLANWGVPIIAMSGSEAHLQAAARTGVAALLHKPFEPIELFDLIDRYCRLAVRPHEQG